MAIEIICDWCGTRIESKRESTELTLAYAPIGHFHGRSGDLSCAGQMLKAIVEVFGESHERPEPHERPETTAEAKPDTGSSATFDWNRVHKERDERVRQLGPEGRERLVLEALGDECLRIGELTDRINSAAGVLELYGQTWPLFGTSDVRNLLKRMLAAGQLERMPGTWRNRPAYLWRRKTMLDGPIADLERAYREGEVA